jgi:hypothetical protein
VVQAHFEIVEEFVETERGTGGFGHRHQMIHVGAAARLLVGSPHSDDLEFFKNKIKRSQPAAQLLHREAGASSLARGKFQLFI